MKTIKIIDLLNKIANGEEVPKEIKVNDKIYHYDETDCNEFYRYRTMTNELLTDYADLNDEVEIIEDGNKIEKIERLKYSTHFDNEEFILYQNILAVNSNLNDVIDYLESSKKSKGNE